MKSSHTAFGVVLLALAGLWYVGGGSAVPTQAAAAAEQPHVSAPVTHNNLTVFFVHGPDAVTDAHKVATLQEALEAGWAVVHETKNVNSLEVENNSSDYELFIQEGDIIKGGQQDRVFAIDMLVPPKSGRVPFPAHCVEAGRWTNRGNESATQFTKSDQRIVGNKLLYANATRQQDAVWANVKTNQDKLSEKLQTSVNAAESESSFQLTLENKNLQAKVAEFETALRTAGETRKNVVGVVFLVNGQVTGAEVYGSNAMFQKAWPRLLRSQAADAVAETTDKPLPPIPSTQEVERFLAMAGQQPAAVTNTTNAETELTNHDVGLQTNLEAAMPDIARAQLQFSGRNGATRTQTLMRNGGGNAAPPVVRNAFIDIQTIQTPAGIERQHPEVAQQRIDMIQLPGIANPAPNGSTSSTGNRLNVQRVEDRAGLRTESRDPARQNALIHKSFIKK